MAGTLKTTFFNLVKYAANDITSWLTDFNGNMDKIDAAMNQNKTAAQSAQDAVDNLEAEYESLLTVVNGHTTSIDASEKAIAANAASIAELTRDVNDVYIGETAFKSDSDATKVETLCSNLVLIGRRIGTDFSGSITFTASAGTFHNYDRVADIPYSKKYVIDLYRLTGNPLNLIAGKWYLGNTVTLSSSNINQSSQLAICYLQDSNFTVIGRAGDTPPPTIGNTLIYQAIF